MCIFFLVLLLSLLATGLHVHGLAHAASGYHKVLDENRKLYNQVQDLKGKIVHSSSYCDLSIPSVYK